MPVSDVIINTLEVARKKGKLKRTDVVTRYLRMKYGLTLSISALEKRIKRVRKLKINK